MRVWTSLQRTRVVVAADRGCRGRLLASEYEIDAVEQELDFGVGDLADALRENRTIDCDDLRDVGDRVVLETGPLGVQQHIAGSGCPAEIARERNDNNRRDAARVERVPLNDYDGPLEPGSRAPRIGERRPADIALSNYHSLRSSARRPASAVQSSTSLPSWSTSSSSDRVTLSGSRRAT